MKKWKAPALFTLALLPIAAIAGYFVTVYQLETLSPALLEESLAQLGSLELLTAITIVQTIGYAAFCGFFGYLLARSCGLMRPFGFDKTPLLRTVMFSVIGGLLFSLDYWTFGAVIEGVQEAVDLSIHSWLASVLYGGVIEEVMLRLFFLSLLAWLIWKVFFRKQETIPNRVLIAANLLAALLFAAGHLPATLALFGSLTPLILLRCFLFNGGAGILFGWLYCQYGIQYAMVSHAVFHIVSKLVWTIFL